MARELETAPAPRIDYDGEDEAIVMQAVKKRDDRRTKRLADQAKRGGRSIEEVRNRLIDGELDRIERERRVQADVLLVTVTKTEARQLEEVVEEMTGQKVTRQRGQAARYRMLGVIGGQRVAAIRLRKQGSWSPEGSAFTCYAACAETGATSVIGVGTAYGVNTIQQQIGDVLVSTSLALYEEGNVREVEASAGPHGVKDAYAYHYEDRGRAVASTSWLNRLRAAQRTQTGTESFHFGTLLTGSAHIESVVFRDELIARVQRIPSDYDPVVGGEMEGAGLAAACVASGSNWIVVKGVSDFATPASREHIETNRIPAAHNAARAVVRALNSTNSGKAHHHG